MMICHMHNCPVETLEVMYIGSVKSHNILDIMTCPFGRIIYGIDYNKRATQEEEGLVAYFNSYHVSHRTNRSQDGGRQARLDGNFLSWRQELSRV